MDFTNRKERLFHLCFVVVTFLWLSGSDGMASFKIFRSERDVFSANCEQQDRKDGSCKQLECSRYGAERVESNGEYCRCMTDRNTFVQIGIAKCKSDVDVEPKSAARETRFELENNVHIGAACLKVESGSSNFVIGEECASPPAIDRLWRWTNKGEKKLMNVKTLQCMQENQDEDEGKVIMTQCEKNSNLQQIVCEEVAGIHIKWNKNKYLHLSRTYSWSNYATSKRSGYSIAHRWIHLTCSTSSDYTGCYRFSDGSFMAYLNYSVTNPKLYISAPIFKENYKCTVQPTFQSLIVGENKWKNNIDSLFYLNEINGTTKELQASDVAKLKNYNGALLKLKVACGTDEHNKADEEHCVLLKLESIPRYSEYTISTSPPTLSPKATSSVTHSTTRKAKEELQEETSKPGVIIPIFIAVAVILFAVALVLLIRFFRSRKSDTDDQETAADLEAVTAEYASLKRREPPSIYEPLTKNDSEPPPEVNYISIIEEPHGKVPPIYHVPEDVKSEERTSKLETETAENNPSEYASLDQNREPPSIYEPLKKRHDSEVNGNQEQSGKDQPHVQDPISPKRKTEMEMERDSPSEYASLKQNRELPSIYQPLTKRE